MTAVPAPPPDPRLYALLAEAGFGDALFNPTQHRSCELVDRYVLQRAVELIGALGLAEPLARPQTLDALLAARGFVSGFRIPLRWLLDRLALEGLVARDAGDTYHLPSPLPRPDLAALRAEGLAADPSYAPVYALVDEAAEIYPAVARGATSGEAALFRKAALWFAYFSNANGYYALNNRVAAGVATARFGAEGGSVLEVGAGLGSATEALLERLAEAGALGRLRSYRATEPVALFRRRAERTLRATQPGVPLAFAPLDVNQPWAPQGIAPGTVDLVWGVTVFHLARRLDATLAEAFAALAPGGWLVVGEGVRPFSGRPVDAEFPFQILESFADVELDPLRRPTHGFLTAEAWLDAIRGAGFEAVEVVPDATRARAFYAGFLAVAACGRRPPGSAA
jgi:SAM-dependent methyltransferase